MLGVVILIPLIFLHMEVREAGECLSPPTLVLPNQLLIYQLEVNIYIGSWALTVRCTQYGFCGQGNLQRIFILLFFFEVGRDGQQFLVGSQIYFQGLPKSRTMWALTLIGKG